MPPPIALFMTTIASQPALRSRQEYILRILQVKKIPYTAYDLASDENAKRLWRRKAPADKQQLPGILVGQRFPGTVADFEDAVEHDELDIFLRRNEEWDPAIDEDRPAPAATAIGVPGAVTPLEMTPERLRKKILAQNSSPSPLKGKIVPVNKRTDEFDVGEHLVGYGLQGVQVTQDELRALAEELGLGKEDAGDLVKGLGDMAITPSQVKAKAKPVEKVATEESTPSEPASEKESASEAEYEKDTTEGTKTEVKAKDAEPVPEPVRAGPSVTIDGALEQPDSSKTDEKNKKGTDAT